MSGEEPPQSPSRQRQFLFDSPSDSTDAPLKSQTFAFDSDVFYSADFDLDAFILEQKRKAPMEKLRDDLVAYHRVLTNSLIELINQDYADFVNLSTNLVGVDRALAAIQQPVQQLRQQVALVLQLMDEAAGDAEQQLASRQLAGRKEATQAAVAASLSLVAKLELWLGQDRGQGDLERCWRAQVRLGRLCRRCRGNQSIENLSQRVAAIDESLQQRLDEALANGLLANDQAAVRSALRAFAAAGRHRLALAIYRDLVVASFLASAVGQDALADADSLAAAYDRIVAFAEEQRQHWAAILDSALAAQYDFLVDALFPECVRHLGASLGLLFNPGNPDKFRLRYAVTMDRFLGKFCEMLASESRAARLRAHPAATELRAKFNLAVYFQIRFHEVTTALDEELAAQELPPSDSSTGAGAGDCELRCSRGLLAALRRLWSDDVFIDGLAGRLWKLSLQALCRYAAFLGDVAERLAAAGRQDDDGACTGGALLLLADTQRLGELVLQFYADGVRPRLAEVVADDSALAAGLRDSLRLWEEPCGRVRRLLADDAVRRSLAAAKLVSEVPRAYRKTNRRPPYQPSPYAGRLLQPLADLLQSERRSALTGRGDAEAGDWLSAWVLGVAPQYRAGLEKVTSSVKKMEESLRMLKSKRPEAGGQGPSDDDKIREQLLLDAAFVRDTCRAWPGGAALSPAAASELDELVRSAEAAKLAASDACRTEL